MTPLFQQLLCVLFVCRSWGIGTGQTESQRAAFRQELSRLEQALEKSGGPFFMGRSVSLVSRALRFYTGAA